MYKLFCPDKVVGKQRYQNEPGYFLPSAISNYFLSKKIGGTHVNF